MEADEVILDMIDQRKRELRDCERTIELLQPDLDRFEANTPRKHSKQINALREAYAQHTKVARKYRKEVDALSEALAALRPT